MSYRPSSRFSSFAERIWEQEEEEMCTNLDEPTKPEAMRVPMVVLMVERKRREMRPSRVEGREEKAQPKMRDTLAEVIPKSANASPVTTGYDVDSTTCVDAEAICSMSSSLGLLRNSCATEAISYKNMEGQHFLQ
ncbi:hypothetical protein Fmac_026976 [Flemingia macrophylla]|uniref:Uncharacterized protein n=1 Tax=Flemingia macrophylla TaxID=520843 RepID=A0ABD1LGE6_9FABA